MRSPRHGDADADADADTDAASAVGTEADSALGTEMQGSTMSITESILAYRTIHGRTYHSDRKAGENLYWGANDEQQIDSLDIMHHALTLTVDGRLHEAPLPAGFAGKALDIGTGTGIWAIDFAEQYPSCQVIGTDLSPIQPSWAPPNCEFQIDDANSAWTFREDSIDYVHIRWLAGSIRDWGEVLAEAYRCLKPGGWFEWFEIDAGLRCANGPLPEDSALRQWELIYTSALRRVSSTASFTIVADGVMQRGLDEAGFINRTERDLILPCSEWSTNERDKTVGLYTHAAIDADAEGFLTMPASVIGWTPEQTTSYTAELRRELRRNRIHGYWSPKVVWAQKPWGPAG